MSTPIDLNSQNGINADRIALIQKFIREAKEFVDNVYIPDILAIASFYTDWAEIWSWS